MWGLTLFQYVVQREQRSLSQGDYQTSPHFCPVLLKNVKEQPMACDGVTAVVCVSGRGAVGARGFQSPLTS